MSTAYLYITSGNEAICHFLEVNSLVITSNSIILAHNNGQLRHIIKIENEAKRPKRVQYNSYNNMTFLGNNGTTSGKTYRPSERYMKS